MNWDITPCRILPGWVAFVWKGGEIIQAFFGLDYSTVEGDARQYASMIRAGLEVQSASELMHAGYNTYEKGWVNK